MSKFLDLINKTSEIIVEQEAAPIDPAMDPAAMAPVAPPATGPVSDAENETPDTSEPDESTEVTSLVSLAREAFLYGLYSTRDQINDADFAKLTVMVNPQNADEIKALLERMIRDNRIETGLK